MISKLAIGWRYQTFGLKLNRRKFLFSLIFLGQPSQQAPCDQAGDGGDHCVRGVLGTHPVRPPPQGYRHVQHLHQGGLPQGHPPNSLSSSGISKQVEDQACS